jgi:hypothetical protein
VDVEAPEVDSAVDEGVEPPEEGVEELVVEGVDEVVVEALDLWAEEEPDPEAPFEAAAPRLAAAVSAGSWPDASCT